MAQSLSFRPHEKLKKTSQFKRVYSKGRRLKSANFRLIYIPTGLDHNRIGFSISSKSIPLATGRVKVKRLLREAYRQSKPALKKAFDIVIIATPGARGLNFQKTRGELEYLFEKAGVL